MFSLLPRCHGLCIFRSSGYSRTSQAAICSGDHHRGCRGERFTRTSESLYPQSVRPAQTPRVARPYTLHLGSPLSEAEILTEVLRRSLETAPA